ncbi:MAG: bacterial transcriptional activator domain-containing protein [Anaerolineae bacterium]|nr:bacterial transcriptional activator domain-containing protein [Anaerolineae bacterium]
MRNSLEIYTFGSFQVKREGNTLPPFPTRKVEALLIYLACTGRPQPREALAGMLWNGRTTQQALANLRAALSRLAHQLAPYLSVTREYIGLNTDCDIWVDVCQLQNVLQEVSALGQMERALSLYRGEFLADFHVQNSRGFENWVLAERTRLRGQVIDAIHRLIEQKNHPGSTVISWAARMLAIDPQREVTHRLMMLTLAQNGHRAEALAQYEACRSALGHEPDAETTALYRQIRGS